MSVLQVLTCVGIAAVPAGDRERSIDVIDDLLPLEATLVQLDSDSWELEGYSHCVSQSVSVTPGSSTETVWIMSLKGKADIISST